MNRTVDMLVLISVVVLLGATGCSALHKSDSARLQGTWKGDEVGASMKGECSLVVSRAHWEFRGGDTNEWYKGDFSLREDASPKQIVLSISECSAPRFIGKTSYGLYRFENDTVTLAVNKPGSSEAPLNFEAPGTRQFVLKKQ
ncbi:MAG TPA: hypothetical protein VN784_08090 [Candidatus Limnocylindrales bacterium]|nr:hypothetical protein [Candidatus Limnocylindrales bacterium]